jgi:hypothetical protein
MESRCRLGILLLLQGRGIDGLKKENHTVYSLF